MQGEEFRPQGEEGIQRREKRRNERRHCGNPVETECEYGRDRIVGDVQLASEDGDDAEVMFPVSPAIAVGESAAASGYCVLSGSGAAVGSGAIVPLANTPAWEKGYSGTPTSSGCIWLVIRTISVIRPCRSFSCRAFGIWDGRQRATSVGVSIGLTTNGRSGPVREHGETRCGAS